LKRKIGQKSLFPPYLLNFPQALSSLLSLTALLPRPNTPSAAAASNMVVQDSMTTMLQRRARAVKSHVIQYLERHEYNALALIGIKQPGSIVAAVLPFLTAAAPPPSPSIIAIVNIIIHAIVIAIATAASSPPLIASPLPTPNPSVSIITKMHR
jgi:hypothetical protein